MAANLQSDEAQFKRDDVRFGAWSVGAVLLLVVLAGYLLNPPLTLARLGEVAGIMGFVLMVLGMLLMVRVPSVAAAAGGLESLYTLHRGVGLAGYGFMLLHPLLLAQQGGWSALELEGKGMAFKLGWVGLVLLMLVLASTFFLKTLGHTVWRRLHTLSVLAFVAIAMHAASYQSDWPILGQVSFNLFLILGVLAPLLRFWLVDRGGISVRYRVDNVTHPAQEVVDVHLSPIQSALEIRPGQFVFARFTPEGAYAGRGHFHPFTARGVTGDGALRLSIRASGPRSDILPHLTPGGVADLQGPFDELFQNTRQNTQVWVAGGFGVAPFLARLRAMDAAHMPVRLFYFFNNVKDAPHLEELERLVRGQSGVTLHPVATYGSGDAIEAIFDAMLPPWNDKQYLLGGTEGFMESVRLYLLQHGVRPEAVIQVPLERA